MDKEYYTLIGVGRQATQEQVRSAYLARMRVIHPDRFNPSTESRAWAEANRLAAELNEAYEVLGDPARRQQYDAQHGHRPTENYHTQGSNTKTNTPRASNTESDALDPIAPGKAYYQDLPEHTQSILLKRQARQRDDQLQISTGGVGVFYLIAALLSAGWLGYLYYAITLPTWSSDAMYWYGAITMVIGLVVGYSLSWILQDRSATLKDYLYVTPLYIIETSLDKVEFWPIWGLTDVKATHHHRNGSFQHTSVAAAFGSEKRTWTFSQKDEFERFARRLQECEQAIKVEYQRGDFVFFLKNDDFRGFKRTHENLSRPPYRSSGWIYVTPILVLFAALLGASEANKAGTEKRWFYHDVPQTVPAIGETVPIEQARRAANVATNGADLSSLWEQSTPIPLGSASLGQGTDSAYQERPHTEPPVDIDAWVAKKELEAARESKTDKTFDPDAYLAKKQESQRRMPTLQELLAQDAQVAGPNLQEPRALSPTPRPLGRPLAPEVSLPANGFTQFLTTAIPQAPLRVVTRGSHNYYAKLCDWQTGAPVVTFFIRAGQTIDLEVPLGSYQLKYASGDTWYGENYLFGEATSYAKADERFDFRVIGDQISGYTVELFLQENGNLRTEAIDPEDF